MTAVQHHVTELRQPPANGRSLEQAELAEGSVGVVVAQRYQCTEVAVDEIRHCILATHRRRQVTNQMLCLLMRDLCGGRQAA